MEIRFCNGADRSPIDVQLPPESPVPRVGDTVLLPAPGRSETSRWLVKSVVWDYSAGGAAADVIVTAMAPARVPSFALYTD